MSPASIHRILLVEDNPADADLIAEYLDGPGAPSLARATTLAEAREQLCAEPPDLVLLDLSLPDGHGLASVTGLRDSTPAVPIVVLTGLHDQELALECLAAGAQDYLFKDEVRAGTLRRAIGYALARWREAQARDKVDEVERRMVAIVEASIDAIVSSDPDRRISTWNRGAEEIFGLPRTAAFGRRIDEIIPPLAAANPAHAEAVEIVRPDGNHVELSIVGFELLNGRGERIGAAAICRDVTMVRVQARELRERNAELEERDRQMRELTARLTSMREEERTRISREVHDELGQLLTGLKMDLRWIGRRLESASPVDRAALVDRIAQAVTLVDQTVATVQRIALELRPSVLDALGLASALRDEGRRFASRSGIGVTVEVDESFGTPPEVATTLFRVVQELLTNVARHAHAQHVTIHLEEEPTGWSVRVEDDGRGLPAEGSSRPALGLLGMRERVSRLGGTISLKNGYQRGVDASIWIPRGREGMGEDDAGTHRG